MALSELSAVSTIDLDLESRSAITFYSCAEVNHPTENLNDGELAASATHWNLPPKPPAGTDPHEQALQCLASRSFSQDELPSLLKAITSGKELANVVPSLQRSDAQVIVDILDEALEGPHLCPGTRKKCMKLLIKICAHHTLFPTSLKIELHDHPSDGVLYRGGFGDVSKRNHQGREVAVKTLRTCTTSDTQAITRRFCKEFVSWKALRHPNVLPLMGVIMTETEFAMVSEWMSNGNINQFVRENPEANRFHLLRDVAKGLVYMHDQGMIHGDLKGANILVDQTCCARLADFGLIGILSDSMASNSQAWGGTIRWMSPELLDPGAEHHSHTIYSDRYAFGMVIYEVLSQRKPFYQHPEFVVYGVISQGDRPGRPNGMEGVWFTNEVWGVLERCWMSQPEDRPSIGDVLRCLEKTSESWIPPSPTQLLAISLTVDSFAGGFFDQNTETSMDSDGVSSPSLEVAPQFTMKLDRGNTVTDTAPHDRFEQHLFTGARNLFPTWNDSCSESGAVIDTALDVWSLPGTTTVLARPIESCAQPLLAEDCVQTLLELDCSSPGFPDHLSNILGRREFEECVGKLELNDVVRVIECLDKAVEMLPSTGIAFERTHRKLQRICTSPMLLPPSYLLTAEALLVEEPPFFCGDFSDAYKGTCNGSQVLCREALLWKQLKHPNIVPFVGVTINPFQITSEWMPGGDLTTYINSNTDVNRIILLVDVANGLDYLHSYGVIHGDLKGSNILVDEFGHARITDFGLAQDTLSFVSLTEGRSARWTAPEVLEESGTPSTAADVFSFAMVMVEAFTGTIPFSDHTSLMAVVSIIHGDRPPRPTHPSLTDGLWELMQRCWDRDICKRPQILEALQALNSLIPIPTLAGISLPLEEPSDPNRLLPLRPVWDIQQQVMDLDPSKEEYRQLLHALLTHPDLEQHAQDPQESDLRALVELLDNALNNIPPADDLFRKTLRILQSICSSYRILPSSCLVPSESLSRGETIGDGSPANPYEANLDGKRVYIRAVKSDVQDPGAVMNNTFFGGVVLWRRLQHPNIVPFLGVPNPIPQPFEVACGLTENGRITEYVRRNPGVDRIGLLLDVANGLNYLHLHNIIHGDLKSTNIRIDICGNARITDFWQASVTRGNSSVVSFQDLDPTIVATWAAPEILDGGAATKEGDIFAFGMVVVETFRGQSSLPKSYGSVISHIKTGEYLQRPEELKRDGLWDLVKWCWDRNPRERPTTFQLLDFFQQSLPRIKRPKKPSYPATNDESDTESALSRKSRAGTGSKLVKFLRSLGQGKSMMSRPSGNLAGSEVEFESPASSRRVLLHRFSTLSL